MIAQGVGTDFQADLADMQNISKSNRGYRYILCVIDILSKMAYCRAIKKKTGEAVRDAFDIISKEWPELNLQKGRRVATDAGKEFLNAPLQKWFKVNNIIHYTLQGDNRAAIVERFQRTLKERLYRMMTFRKSYKYTDILPLAIQSYNRSKHRTLRGYRPVEVIKDSKIEQQVYENQFVTTKHEITRGPKDDISIGDTVQISVGKNLYSKGYTGYWREELFTVDQIKQGVPNKIYILKDRNGEILQGGFYREQIQKVGV